MKPAKILVLAAAVIAILGVFALPYFKAGSETLTLWKAHSTFKELGFPHPIIILVTMIPAALIGGLAMSTGKFGRGLAVVTTLLFVVATFIGWAAFKKIHLSFGDNGAIGAKLMMLAFVAGLVGSIGAIAKPDRG
ncbi:MAG TPA: hypothetical protein VHE35_24535 [Kofleriaceae bacterium]|nr:hypothetical protein [Kofleriaceae bacterium]